MQNKTQEYLNLAQQTAKELTRYWESWTDYLTTASRLYKYPFADQLMIYAQRPDATACAEFDIWRNRMNRYVRRGSKGIALLDESSGFPRLHYVFDVSDTGVRRNSRDPEVWQFNDDLKQPVSEMLAATYGISGERVSQQLADVAGKLVADYWDNNGEDIRAIVDGSLLMDYDDAGVEIQFKSAAAISVTYTLLERCGFEPAGWFDKDDFRAIHEFSTPDSVYALGAAVSDMSREVLRQIERTVKTTIRRRNNERSQHEYEQQSELHADRGLSSPEDYIDGKLHVFDKDWPELPFAHREHIGCTVDYVSGRNRYMGYLISLGIYSFKGVKVGLDCANGSSWNIAKSVFDALGADTYVINAQPNGTNINNNAGSTHIEGLQKFVVEKGLDIGFAYDGDADRCLCVDEKGNVITGDHILYIYGCYMKERGKLLTNTVVTTVMSNFGLYKAFDEKGIGYAKTAVGDKYVYEYMAKNGCRIGGEQSGHIIFSKYASTGDGILTSLKMMEVMLAKKMPMSKLAEPLKIYPQVLENVRVTDKKAAQNDPAVQEAVKAVAEALGDIGRILVRESGTEPLVRVMVEAPDHDTCQKYVSQVVEVIKNKGYAV